MYTINKRIIAALLLFSQLLTSCGVNVNLPNKQELQGAEEKATPTPTSLDASNRAIFEEEDLSLLTFSSLNPLTSEQTLTSSQVNLRTPSAISRSLIADPNPSTIVSPQGQRIIGNTRYRPLKKESNTHKHSLQNKRLNQQAAAMSPAKPSKLADEANLEELTITAKGGYPVKLYKVQGHWIATVEENQGFLSRTLHLTIRIAPGFSLKDLFNHQRDWHQRYVQVVFPEKTPHNQGYLCIGMTGIVGGMKGQQKSKCPYPEDQRRWDPQLGKYVCPGKDKHDRYGNSNPTPSGNSVSASTASNSPSRPNPTSSSNTSTSPFIHMLNPRAVGSVNQNPTKPSKNYSSTSSSNAYQEWLQEQELKSYNQTMRAIQAEKSIKEAKKRNQAIRDEISAIKEKILSQAPNIIGANKKSVVEQIKEFINFREEVAAAIIKVDKLDWQIDDSFYESRQRANTELLKLDDQLGNLLKGLKVNIKDKFFAKYAHKLKDKLAHVNDSKQAAHILKKIRKLVSKLGITLHTDLELEDLYNDLKAKKKWLICVENTKKITEEIQQRLAALPIVGQQQEIDFIKAIEEGKKLESYIVNTLDDIDKKYDLDEELLLPFHPFHVPNELTTFKEPIKKEEKKEEEKEKEVELLKEVIDRPDLPDRLFEKVWGENWQEKFKRKIRRQRKYKASRKEKKALVAPLREMRFLVDSRLRDYRKFDYDYKYKTLIQYATQQGLQYIENKETELDKLFSYPVDRYKVEVRRKLGEEGRFLSFCKEEIFPSGEHVDIEKFLESMEVVVIGERLGMSKSEMQSIPVDLSSIKTLELEQMDRMNYTFFIERINKEIELAGEKYNRLIKEGKYPQQIIEEASNFSRKLYDVILRVREFPTSQKDRDKKLAYLEKLDAEIQGKIKLEKHNILIKNIKEEIEREIDKLKEFIKQDNNLRQIIYEASRCRYAVELLKSRLKSHKFRQEEVLNFIQDGIIEIDRVVSEQKEKIVKGVFGEDKQEVIKAIRKFEKVVNELEGARIALKQAKGKAEKIARKLKIYQDRKRRIARGIQEAQEIEKKAEPELAYRRSQPTKDNYYNDYNNFTITLVLRILNQAKEEIKDGNNKLGPTKLLIEEYKRKLDIANKNLIKAQEVERLATEQQAREWNDQTGKAKINQQEGVYPASISEKREALEKQAKDHLAICQEDTTFTKQREAFLATVEKLKQDPKNKALQALKAEQLASYQSHPLYQQSIEIGIEAAALRLEAERKSAAPVIFGLGPAAKGICLTEDKGKVEKYKQEAEELKENVIRPLRDVLGCPNSPRGVKRVTEGIKGFGESFYDVGKALLVDLPILLANLNVKPGEPLLKWKNKLNAQEGGVTLSEACSVLFNEVRQEWEDPAAYEARMEAVRELQEREHLYRRVFDAENYHLGKDNMVGYATAEIIQFIFGGEIIKGVVKGVGKGAEFAKGVQRASKLEQGVAEGDKVVGKGVEIAKLMEKDKIVESIHKGERYLIGPAGDAGARFVNKMPKHWLTKPAKKGIGTKYINPNNPGDYIRFSAENLDPRAPLGQQISYFERWKDGKCLIREGKWVYPNTVTKDKYHIPQSMLDEFLHLLDF